MAKFDGVLSEGNLGGGIYTSSPFSVFSNVVVRNNHGPGIVDASSDGLFEKALSDAVSQGLPRHLADQFRHETGDMMDAVHKRDQKTGLEKYERLMALADSHASVLVPLIGPIQRMLVSLGWL